MWRGDGAHSVEGMQLFLVAMTLAASVQAPVAATTSSCEFVYLRDNAGYSQCDSGTGYQHRADGWCSWMGPFDPTGISEYAAVGPWAEPTGNSSVSCPKYYYLTAEVE